MSYKELNTSLKCLILYQLDIDKVPRWDENVVIQRSV
jgi:hypothetical protein